MRLNQSNRPQALKPTLPTFYTHDHKIATAIRHASWCPWPTLCVDAWHDMCNDIPYDIQDTKYNSLNMHNTKHGRAR